MANNRKAAGAYLAAFFVHLYRSGLFKITKAAITPGTQPHSHNINTIAIDPQPLPITASGGKNMASKTLQILIH